MKLVIRLPAGFTAGEVTTVLLAMMDRAEEQRGRRRQMRRRRKLYKVQSIRQAAVEEATR